MLKLIKLEWRKNNIGKYIRGAVITAAMLGLFIFALAFLGIANDPDGTLEWKIFQLLLNFLPVWHSLFIQA